jgi:DNA-binding transcriptional LysR family regulator
LPKIAIRHEHAGQKLAIVPWRGPALVMNTPMAWHQDKLLSPALQSFVSLSREYLGSS